MMSSLQNKRATIVLNINSTVLTFRNVLVVEDSELFIAFEDPKNNNKIRKFNKSLIQEINEI